MIEIRRILCPLDFSKESRHALEHAVTIAKWYEAQIAALHVIHVPPFPYPPILSAAFASPARSNPAERQACEAELRAWLEPAQQAGIKTDVIVDEGDAARQILQHATSRQIDLIVMGTHGLSGFERLILGSVAEKVLRKAKCPVMVVPPTAQTTAKVPYTRLLCPVDFSESSLRALRYAFSIAKEADAGITLLNVIDWPLDDELVGRSLDAPEFRRHLEAAALGRLEALVTDDVRVWCKPSTKITYGKPYREVLETATSEGADLIVIGVHGRNPLDQTVFGSTTNQVVRHASCPVLTLRS